MTVNLCVVSGTLVAPDGSPLPEVQVQFLPAPVTMRGRAAQTLAPRPVAVTTDAAAGLSVGLAPGVYSLRAREAGGREYEACLVEVPARETAELSEILQHLPAPQSVYDAAASARVAARAAGRSEEIAAAIAEGDRTRSQFASRAAFEAAEIAEGLESWSVRHAGHVLDYRRDPAGTAIQSANGVKGSPEGTPSALHWGAAPEATAAVNTAALNACAAWGREIRLPAGLFRLNGTVLFAPANPTGIAACVVQGAGNGATILLQENHDADTLRFVHQDPDRSLCIRPQVRDLTIRYAGATTAATGAAIRHRHALNGVFENLSLDGASWGIVTERGGQCWFSKLYFETLSRAPGNRAQAHLVFDHDPVKQAGFTFGHFLSNIEAHGAGPGALRNILIRCVDGLYIANSHFGWAERHIEISPDGTGGRTAVFDVRAANTYFDMGGPSGNIIDRHILVRAPGAAPTIQIRGLHFAQCLFRGDNAARAFAFDQEEGALSGAQFVQSVKFTGCEFRLFNNPALDFTPPAGFDALNRLREIAVSDCLHSPRQTVDPANPAVLIAGRTVSLTGNSYSSGLWRAAGPRPIRVLAASRAVTVANELFHADAERSPWDNVLIDTGASHVSVRGLAGAGAAIPPEIAEQGENELGWWRRYTDGRQIVGRSITLEGVAINVAYGALFRSNSLLATTAEREFPRPFMAGEKPHVLASARIDNHMGLTLLGGPALNNLWPATIRVASEQSLPSRTVHLVLRAEGRWK